MEFGPKCHIRTGDASDHTRYIRMRAELAPYIAKGVNPAPSTLGWRDMAANRDAKVVAPVFSFVRGLFPNAG